MIRKLVCLLLLFALCAVGTAVSESTQITAGDWAFTHAPEESVLLLREDGTAVFKGQEYSWTGDGEFIRLAAEGGEEISLRFVSTEVFPEPAPARIKSCAPLRWSCNTAALWSAFRPFKMLSASIWTSMESPPAWRHHLEKDRLSSLVESLVRLPAKQEGKRTEQA